jgi:hypothetical protein
LRGKTTKPGLPDRAPGDEPAEHDRNPDRRVDPEHSERRCEPTTSRTVQERRPVVARDRGAAGERGKNRTVPAGQQRPNRRLGDVGDPGHRERAEAGDAKQAARKDEVEGQVIKKGTAKSVMPLLLQGQVTEFYPGGAKKSVSLYKNNQLISNENWREDGQKYIDNIFYSADVYPTYSLGNKVLNNHIMQCYKNSGLDISTISGSLKVGFVVMEDGSIDGIKILKGLGPKLNETACHAFATLKGQWTPAKLNNKTVRYFQVFPINFIFNEDRLEYAEIRDAVLHYQNY